MPSTLSVTITSPEGSVPSVTRPFRVAGRINLQPASGRTTINSTVTVRFGDGGPSQTLDLGNSANWECTGAPDPAVPPGATITVYVTARVSLRFFHNPSEPDIETLNASTSKVVRMPAPIAPNVAINTFSSPILAAQMPVSITFTGTSSGVQSAVARVQYKVENGEFFDAVKVGGSWAQWKVTLPVAPGDHVLMVRAIDGYGTIGSVQRNFSARLQPPLVVPPGSRTTLLGVPTTASITSWTRLEPRSAKADMGSSSSARLFDPLWLLTRQWQMGEFQAEDAGTPVQARVRATNALLTRCHFGAVPRTSLQAPAYDPARTPLEVLVARRRMRAADADDSRMLTFAVEAGLHFLRMLEQQTLSQNYRAVFLSRLALQPTASASPASTDDPTTRFVQAMSGRAPDARILAAILRTGGPAQLVQDAALDIATADRAKVRQVATAWLAWYDNVYSEPVDPAEDAWIPERLEYATSVAARLSAAAPDELTFCADELDGGPLDWGSFDVNSQATLGTAADTGFAALVEATVPSPVSFRGAPAPRFWELEDANVAYGLVPVGPTDLAHLMMIEYASTYGNDWFVVPITVRVGSVTRVESLVVTDTFGVRSLLRPIGDPALPAPHFSMWQSAYWRPPGNVAPTARVAANRFFLPPTLGRTLDGPPVEDVLFMRDETANLAWAIERSIESPIERPARRYDAADAAPEGADPVEGDLPRYVLSSRVPPNWIPLLPVQIRDAAGRTTVRLRRGAVLQPDGSQRIHRAVGEVLNAAADLLLYDEEVPREGVNVTRQRRLARWSDGSTWLWTSLRNQVGRGEGASALRFDQLHEPNDPSRTQSARDREGS